MTKYCRQSKETIEILKLHLTRIQINRNRYNSSENNGETIEINECQKKEIPKTNNQSSIETQIPKIIERKHKTFGNIKQQSQIMQAKVNLQDSIKTTRISNTKIKLKVKISKLP